MEDKFEVWARTQVQHLKRELSEAKVMREMWGVRVERIKNEIQSIESILGTGAGE